MTKKTPKDPSPNKTLPAKNREADRKKRLAEQLRQNLRRRKQNT